MGQMLGDARLARDGRGNYVDLRSRHGSASIELRSVAEPPRDCDLTPVALSDETMAARKQAVLDKMRERSLDTLVLYADLEHGGNFEYLVGFLPRFEEALLVLHANGEAVLVLGNENLNKASKARLAATPLHAPHLSLPNQPMGGVRRFADILKGAGLSSKRVGVVGWKYFTSPVEDNAGLFDIPAFVYQALVELCGAENLSNETGIFIGPDGVREVCCANEIAHYEFGASLASDCMLDALNALEQGVSELEVADKLVRYGQQTSVVSIAAFGPRFVKANMYPTNKTLEVGESVSLTVGYKGGLSSRAGYAVASADDLPAGSKGYLDDLAIPYFTSIRTWLENVHVGMMGGEVYDLIEGVLPKETYNWSLCPGHLVADEEWLCSPIYEGSQEVLASGMMLQTDIIPSREGYAGVSAESTCALADQELRLEIERTYPQMWGRICKRRKYVKDELGIELSEDILPLGGTMAYMRPFLLSRRVLAVKR